VIRQSGETATPGKPPALEETSPGAGAELRLLLDLAPKIAGARDFDDALVTGVEIPEMSGRDLFALFALRPNLRVPFPARDGPEHAGGDATFLPKPFAPGDLALGLREVLDGNPATR
jgi:hypothetical protein